MSYLADKKNCELYIVNGIVCDFFDAGVRPTAKQVVCAWEKMHESREFTHMDVEWIIAKVAKFYN